MRNWVQIVESAAAPKALFTAGVPGSGKTTVCAQMADRFGFCAIDSDRHLERLMRRANLSLKMPPEEAKEVKALRVQALASLDRVQHRRIMQRRDICIDTTANDLKWIAEFNEELKDQGYETAMVFLDVPLDVSKERNKARARTLPDHVLDTVHDNLERNRAMLARIFGDRFYVYENGSEEALGELCTRVGEWAR